VAVRAALATLARLDDGVYRYLEELGGQLEAGLRKAIEAAGATACVQRVGSMLTVFFARGPVRSWADAQQCDTARFARFHQGLLAEGVYWPPSQFEAAFFSTAHTRADVERTVKAAERALRV
jgi:glutamate-1-semialdehyde 2,1-aminomutase